MYSAGETISVKDSIAEAVHEFPGNPPAHVVGAPDWIAAGLYAAQQQPFDANRKAGEDDGACDPSTENAGEVSKVTVDLECLELVCHEGNG